MSDYTIPITRPTSTQNTSNPVQPTPQPSFFVPPQTSEPVPQQNSYPTEWIDLPSQGYFYPQNHPLSSGKVEVKVMTAKEEDILTNANYIKNGVVLDRLLESVLINKNIKPNDFLIGDKNAVFIALRRLAYGDSYGPLALRCNSCKEESKDVVINLADIKSKEYDFNHVNKHDNLFEFPLPFSKHHIVFKLLTAKDEAEIEGELKAANKLKISSSELTTRLRHTIVSINGNTDKAFIKKFVENELLTKDSLALRQYIRAVTPNIDLTFEFTCPHCQTEERVGLPLTAQFFWPDATR